MNEDDLKNAGFRSKRTRDRRPKKSKKFDQNDLETEILRAHYANRPSKVLKIKDPGGTIIVGKSAAVFSRPDEGWQVEHPGGRIRFSTLERAAEWVTANVVGWTKFEIVARPKDWGEA